MAYLATELWREILVRLGVKELMRLRCVCSSWRNIIDCPMFHAQHATRPSSFPAQILILFSDNVYYVLGLEKISPGIEPITEPIRARVVSIKSKIRDRCQFRGLDHSYNGLLLVDGRSPVKRGLVHAWNPLTGRYLDFHVSDLNSKAKGYDIYYGIGFDKFTGDCKVVFIRHHYGIPSTDVYVCKLRSPSCWKRMESPLEAAVHYPRFLHPDGVLVSGALHWMVEYVSEVVVKNNSQFSRSIVSVLAIDLGTEKYSLISLPQTGPSWGCYSKVVLCVLGGCLCMSFTNTCRKHEAWVMKDYGLVDSADSWSMLYVVEHQELGPQFPITKRARPVAYSDCGTQVLISLGEDLVWYHLQNKTVEHITLEGWQKSEAHWKRRSFTAIEHAGSFLPMELQIPATMQRETKKP